jgi:flap endonuclease-1
MDTNLFIYQNVSAIGSRYNDFTDASGNPTNHLIGLFYRIIGMLESNVKPVFVFDGKPIHMKEKTIRERGHITSKSIITTAIEQSKELITLFGIPIVNAVHDAEAELANLSRDRKIDYSSTLDYDIFLFGAENVLRYYPSTQKGRITEHINLQEFLKGIGFSREQLVYFGLLIGTDFNDKIPRVGPKKALELVKEYKTWDKIANAVENKYISTSIKDCFGQDPQEIIDYFINPPSAKVSLERKPIEFKQITQYLTEKEFNRDRIKKAFNRLRKQQPSSKLSEWF